MRHQPGTRVTLNALHNLIEGLMHFTTLQKDLDLAPTRQTSTRPPNDDHSQPGRTALILALTAC